MQIEIENAIPLLPAPLTIHTCDRSPKSFDTIRKVIALCGMKLEIRQTLRGSFRSAVPTGELSSIFGKPCCTGKDCRHCSERIEQMKELIKIGC